MDPYRRTSGFTLVELLFAVTFMALGAAMAVPQVTAGLERSRAHAAARYLASQMQLARARAVQRATSVAIRFGDEASGFEMATFVDGNGNGIRTKDIAAAVDAPLGSPDRLGSRFPGVRIGATPGAGGAAGSPVRIGTSGLLTFTAGGTATPGSVYVLGGDGSQFVVRITGATARTRVLVYVPQRNEWISP